MVELKTGPLGPYRGFVGRVIGALRERGALERTWLASSSSGYLQEARRLAPGLRCELPGREGVSRIANALRLRRAQGFAFALLQAGAVAREHRRAVRVEGLLRFAILPDRLLGEEAKKLVVSCLSAGIDGILTDSMQWREFGGSGPPSRP